MYGPGRRTAPAWELGIEALEQVVVPEHLENLGGGGEKKKRNHQYSTVRTLGYLYASHRTSGTLDLFHLIH